MSGRPGVDFVVGDEPPPGDGEEELAQPPRRAGRLRWVLLPVAAALVAGLLLAGHHGADHPTAAAPSSPFTPPPDVGGVTQPVQLPEGNRHSPQPVGCPPDAECYVASDQVPVGLMTALRARFPGAQLTSATSVLANRPGHFGPDLVSRVAHARAGGTTVTVSVHKPTGGERGRVTRGGHGTTRVVSATVVGSAFTVTVAVEQRGVHGPATRGTVEGIAHDERLVAPQ